MVPGCNHIFHEDCIEQWILKASSNSVVCPVCRIDIKDKLDSRDSSSEASTSIEMNTVPSKISEDQPQPDEIEEYHENSEANQEMNISSAIMISEEDEEHSSLV